MAMIPSLVVTAISIDFGLNLEHHDQSLTSTTSVKNPRSRLHTDIFLFAPEARKNSPE
jgi:hypothetical protein